MKKLTTVRLAAATYFLVAGGPYGLEELIQAGGFTRAVATILVMPIVFSLPIAFMVGELATALPEEGGYYAWTRRAFGPTWGFVDAWLSLCASFFDMAIYPLLFVSYLKNVWPGADEGFARIALGLGLMLGCTLWNLRGARSVGNMSVVLSAVLLGPFVVFGIFAFSSGAPAPEAAASAASAPLGAGLLVAMWNFMGWDNASTFAAEVDHPQRTYPRAMALAVGAVTITYLLPVVAAIRSGLPAESWSTGAWVDAARNVGGPALGWAVVAGGCICGIGMYNALLLSFSRLPAAMAEDGLLPKALARTNARGVPFVSVFVCSALYAVGLLFSFKRLIEIDILFYGISIMLEFVALVALRFKEPDLPRPFRIPGGKAGTIAVAVAPGALFVFAFAHEMGSGEDHSLSLVGAAACAVVGLVVWVRRRRVAIA